MAAFTFWVSLVVVGVVVLTSTELFAGMRRVARLEGVPPLTESRLPVVTIIIPARNEERNLEEALLSVLSLDYPDYEVIVLDDRSTDHTSGILARLASRHERLRSIRIDKLPAGWLGKNYALWLGAEHASGEYLVFTDADVVMAPDVLRRAMAIARQKELSHLTVAPQVRSSGIVLNAFIVTFSLFFWLSTKPWRASDPKSRHHIGLGAFNLVSRRAYREAGTHEKIRLRPDDDLKLGKIIKGAGFRQDVAFGSESLQVEWYASLGELVRGLEKNVFAGVEYSVTAVILSTLALFAFFLWPYVALFCTSGAVLVVNIGSVVILSALYFDQARLQGRAFGYVILSPVCVGLLLFIVWRSTLLTLWSGGIRWRDTFYSLEELRQNRV